MSNSSVETKTDAPAAEAIVEYKAPSAEEIQAMQAADVVKAMAELAKARKPVELRVYRRRFGLMIDCISADHPDEKKRIELEKTEEALLDRYFPFKNLFTGDVERSAELSREALEGLCGFSRDHETFLASMSPWAAKNDKWVANLKRFAELVRAQEAQTAELQARLDRM
jgi:hypothetical protein